MDLMTELIEENKRLAHELKIKNSWIKQAFFGYMVIACVIVLVFAWLVMV